MKQRVTTLLCLLFIIIAGGAKAQTDSTGSKKMQFKLSANYNSNLHYYGRTDSLRSTGFFPMGELWITPQFYINAAPVFVTNALQSFDYAGTVTTMGFLKSSKKWMRHFYVLKPFYETGSTLVQSALKAQSGATFTRLGKRLNLTAGADVKWSNQMDIGATAGLDHIFRIENRNKNVLVIDPSVYAFAGTRQFSKTYTKKKSRGLLLPPSEQRITETENTFSLLAYEVSVPLIYAKGHWQVLATPSYVLPQQLMQVEGRPDLSETGRNLFYATLAVKHIF
jgi:hypothetical protein